MAKTSGFFTSESAPRGKADIPNSGMQKGSVTTKTRYRQYVELLDEWNFSLADLLNRSDFDTMGDLLDHVRNKNEYKLPMMVRMKIVILLEAMKRGDMRAIESVENRLFGKPKESIEVQDVTDYSKLEERMAKLREKYYATEPKDVTPKLAKLENAT